MDALVAAVALCELSKEFVINVETESEQSQEFSAHEEILEDESSSSEDSYRPTASLSRSRPQRRKCMRVALKKPRRPRRRSTREERLQKQLEIACSSGMFSRTYTRKRVRVE